MISFEDFQVLDSGWNRYQQDILDDVFDTEEDDFIDYEDQLINEMLNGEDYVIYNNSSGRSGVGSYKYAENYIIVRFKDGSIYAYTDDYINPTELQNLKGLADHGSGLNGYLTRIIYDRWTIRIYKDIITTK